ncbi:MAG: InlB B-repeat-containing protein [Clostridia bacterium]|nr:InlB B-repeat-containing protein [Clostridia bacterium]
MKLIKRSVSVFLAVLMIFSSFSLLATAAESAVEDTNPITTKADYNWAIDTIFYRQKRTTTGEIITDNWIPTENVMKDETVKARVFMKTDFPLANSQFFFLYPSNFLTMDVTNCPPTSGGYELLTGGINGFDGNFDYSTECDAVFQEMVDEGYLTEDDIIDRGWIYVNMDTGTSPYQLDGSQWLFEFEFTVNKDATNVGQLYLSAECIADNDKYMGRTDITANPYNDDYQDGDLSSWTDMTFGYTLNDTDANSTIDLYSSLTFDAGEGKFADGTSTFTVENYEVQATTPIDNFPGAPVLEGEEFLGWVPAEKYDNYTAEDLINDEYVLKGNYNYQHEEATYKAVYTTENTVTVNVHYYDLVKKEDVVVDTNKYATKTGYAVEIIADEDIPAEIPAETTYIAFSKLPAIEHYKFDSTNALNVLKVESAAENGASTLDVYYIPETYTVTFNPANGGAVATNSDVVYYTELTSPAAPEKSGWKFTEWLGDDEDKSTLGAEQKFNVTGNVNYVAQYESAETTVAVKVKYTDLANNKEEKIVPHTTVDTIAGYTVALVETAGDAENTTYYLIKDLPVIEHYEYDADSTTTTVTAAADGTSELIVAYKPKKYTATFTGAETMGNVDYYTELTVPAGPVEDGKTFVKWVGSDGTELVPGTAEAPATFILKGDVIYTADYSLNTYNTTLSFTGEAGVDYPVTATLPTVKPGNIGDEIVLNDPDPVTGWEFNGWDTPVGAVEKDGKYYYGTSDVTVSGSWTHTVYYINYWLDDAKTIQYGDTAEAYYDEPIELIDGPTENELALSGINGKKFNEWICDYTEMPAANVDVIADLESILYTVNVRYTDGTTETLYRYYGEEVTIDDLPDIEDIEGYTFSSWTINGKKNATLPYKVVGTTSILGNFDIHKWDLYYWIDEDAYKAFDTEKAVEPIMHVEDLDYGSEILNIPANPEKEGHVFTSWDTDPVGAEMGDGDMHFFACWRPETYTVIWDNEGEKETVENVPYGSVLEIPAPTKTGYTLKGWTGLEIAEEGDTTMPDVGDNGATITYYADWEANKYPVTFNANGGIFADNTDEKTIEVAYGDTIKAPEIPTRSGYAWGGWNPADLGTMDTTDGKKVFNATWIASDVNYTIETYIMDTEGKYGDPTVETKPSTTDANVSVTPEIKTGFKVDEAASKLSGTVGVDGLTLKIYYIREQYTLKKVVEDKTTTTILYYGAKVSLEEPGKTGHSFGGWTWTNDADETVAAPATMPAYNVTATASFTPNTHNVIYKVNGEVYQTIENVAYGTQVTVIAKPVETGKTFSDWDKTDFTMPDEDVIINCTATVNTHDVIYKVNGEVYKTVEDVAYGTQVTVIAKPVETGKTFSDWDKTDFTMPDEDVVINCTATVNTHDVIYMVGNAEHARIKDVAYGTQVTILADLKEDGKTFSGWTINGVKAEDFTMPDNDVTIVGSWTVNDFTVTYFKDKNKTDVHYTYTGAYGAEYNVPAIDKEGHEFLGWFNADGSEANLPAAGELTTVPLNGAVYYADWKVNEYELVYNAGAGKFADGKNTVTFNTAYGTAQADWKVPEVPTRAGYTFGGWNVTSTDTMPASKKVITAIWNAIPYTVTWINGSQQIVDDYIYGNEIIAPEEPSRTGWTFTGWLEADGVTYFSEGDVMGEKSLVYTAQWEGNEGITYEIYRYFAPTEGTEWMDSTEAEKLYGKPGMTSLTGKAGETAKVDTAAEAVAGFYIDEENSILSKEIAGNGSTDLVIYYLREKVNVTVKDPDGETYYEGEVDFGDEITVPDPEKEGHEFDKWVDEDGNTVTFPMPAPSEDIVIKPVWTVNKYGITFVDDNGDVIQATKEVEYGSTIVAPEDPKKEGYNFAYWRDKETKAVMPATMPAKDVTYEAYYTAGEDTTYYIEVYMMDTNGEYTMASQTIATGTTGDPISITPGTVEGCTYDATKSVLTGIITAEGTTLKVYYARNKYTVTFNSGDGVFADDATVVGPTSVYFGAAIPVPAAPAREGYDFTGWDKEVPATMPADNLTFNATWTEAEYTITYIINDKKEVVPYKFGADVATPDEPVVEGMTFLDWDTEIPVTMPAKDLIIIALFETAVYKVTFMIDGEVYEEIMVKAGSEIPVPSVEPTKEYHVFAGWQNVPATMPANDIEIEGKFDRVPVKLVPYDDNATTVIDDENKAIYGLAEDMEEGLLRAAYLRVEGDGYFTVTPSKAASGRVICGTGAVVKLYDRMGTEDESDDVLKETYTIVIFGDLNGDARISNTDYSIAQAEVDWITTWSDPMSSDYNLYKTMAADFNGDSMISVGEASSIERAVLGTVDFDQTTGTVIRD